MDASSSRPAKCEPPCPSKNCEETNQPILEGEIPCPLPVVAVQSECAESDLQPVMHVSQLPLLTATLRMGRGNPTESTWETETQRDMT